LRVQEAVARRAAFFLAWAAGMLACWAADALAAVELPRSDAAQPIFVQAEAGVRWTQGSYEVWVLRGGCRIQQGPSSAQGREAVLWIDRASPTERRQSLVIAYVEGDVSVDLQRSGNRARLTDARWLGRFQTALPVEVRVDQLGEPAESPPAIYQRGLAERNGRVDAGVRQAQFVQPPPTPPAAGVPPPAPATGVPPPGTRRIRAFARSGVPVVVQWIPDQQHNQWIGIIESGVNILVEGVTIPGQERLRGLVPPTGLGVLDLSADRVVVWTAGLEQIDLKQGHLQGQDVPLEIYMEGNIVFRQGERVIYAEKMYYDVTNRTGTVLGAEMLTPVPKYEGLLRLRAEVVQQLGEDRFFAQSAFITSSRLGVPRYRLQAASVLLEDPQEPLVDPVTGLPLVDPQTGQAKLEHHPMVTAENNVVYFEEIPVFYWPYLATDLSESSLFLRRARFRSDSIFGVQVLTDWNVYQLLGIRNRPPGTDWGLSLDWMSERGFGHGTTFSYRLDESSILPGAAGLVDYWGILDHGNDNLGRDRRSVPPLVDYRYRLFLQHRQVFRGDWQLSAEVGLTSDRNFLEGYFEREWDEMKDHDTALELKKIRDNTSLSVLAAVRVNDFLTQTDWLPRGDHFWLGESLGDDVFTWYEHSSVAYAQFHTATLPAPAQDPQQKTRFLPWEVSPGTTPLSTQAGRFITRQEIDWPFQLGPVKIVPYALGEAGYWGEDITGEDVSRLYGQVGVRASIPAWAANPNVESMLWNVHGLAHKITFDAEFAFADASRNLDQFPLYDPLDDDAIEAFRRRFVPNTFPGAAATPWPRPAIPPQFDERFYAVRSGMAGWVTAPSMEIAEDLMVFRLGMHNRWQTKRGTPGHQRIVDWLTLDVNLSFFPKDVRDNFGEVLGLLDYNARWQIGDRLALLSSGEFDFFHGGGQIVNVGAFLDRPPRGGWYAGVRLLEGPIHNTVLITSYSYRMSPKWVSAFSLFLDLRDQANIGQSFTVTRIGESFLISAGFNYDASKGTWGAAFSFEPRFLPKTRLGQAGGARIPVAGAYGLE